MDQLIAWGMFPLLLSATAVGCGLLVRAASGARALPRALVPAAGLALIVVVAQALTLADATAELATPVAAALAVVGLVVGREALRPVPRWGLAAAAGVFAIYAAPVVLSGEATFAGYIRLDDTATWMAFTDHVMEHGRSLEGLAPSTYEAALSFNVGDGYPVGVFLPLGIGAELAGEDVAWLVQPYLAWLAAVLSLALWRLAGGIVASVPLRAVVAFVGAQAALLYGYALWGGIKELAAAALIAAAAALLGVAAAAGFTPRALFPPVLAAAALIGVLSGGGALWLAPIAALGVALAATRLGPARALLTGVAAAVAVAVLALPVLAVDPLPPTASPLDDADARGNLIEPLDPAQVAGVWPVGDFRLEPDAEALVAGLIAVAALAAALGFAAAVRRRAWGVVGYVGASMAGAAGIYALGSPWVDGKALATASPAIPFVAAVGAAAVAARGRRVEGALLLVVVAGGVMWSNALAYRDVSLAPRAHLEELAEIGETVAGEGPTLITEYQPYAARHFLREADPEAVSELRRRAIPLRDGSRVAKGRSADTDAIDPEALFVYRTLVLRRSPAQSRPPGAYDLAWRGRYYEAWQRPPGRAAPSPRLALGERLDPSGRPPCRAVRRLARRGPLVAAKAPPPVVAGLGENGAAAATPDPRRALRATARVPRAGSYEVWVRGSVRPEATLRVDGRVVGTVRHELNNEGGYVSFGSAELEDGRHSLALSLEEPDLHPGSGGPPAALGPAVLSMGAAAEAEVVRVGRDPVCGREWDWVEAR